MNKTTPHNVIIWLWDATSFYDSKGQRVPLTNAQSSLMNLLAGIEVQGTLRKPSVQAYFGRPKAACFCSYYCNHHLCYDGGRLGRVKTVTLRVGARAKEGKKWGGGEKKYSSLSPPPTRLLLTRPIFSPITNMRFREKNIRALEENACTADYYNGGDSNGNANTSIRLRGSLSKNRPLNFAWKKKICLKLWQVIVKGFIETMNKIGFLFDSQ